ncbi:IclR family transcriptional regulator [Glaciecola sp. 33A]|nr:IclR family transcriptional regulator [Glaciecola sp. 33A]
MENALVKTESEQSNRYMVPGLIRGLKILQAFSSEKPFLGVSDIARELDVSRSTAFRLSLTLENMGFLKRVKHSKKYCLGLKVLDLGFKLLAGMDIVDIARPHMEELSENTKVCSHLAVRDGISVVYIARILGKHHTVSSVGVGTRFPAYATSTGRILLANLSIAELATLYEGIELKKITKNTPLTIGDLINQIEQDKSDGYTLSWETYEKNLASLAVPIRDNTREIVASLNVSCPTTTYSRSELLEQVLPELMQKAASISTALGYRH